MDLHDEYLKYFCMSDETESTDVDEVDAEDDEDEDEDEDEGDEPGDDTSTE